MLLTAVAAAAWLAALWCAARALRPPRVRRRGVAALGAGVAACCLTAAAWVFHREGATRQAALTRYHAAIDAQRRGDPLEAERLLEEARQLRPGDPAVEEALRAARRAREARPVERREQVRSATVDPGATAPVPHPTETMPPAPGPEQEPVPPRTHRPPGTPVRPVPHVPSPFAIVGYTLGVTLRPEAHALSAVATVRVRSRGAAVPELAFSLAPEFRPTAATVGGSRASMRRENDLLALRPARPLRAGEETVVVIRYSRSGGPEVEGGSVIAAEGTALRTEARWYPATGELDFRAPVSVRVHVPAGYVAVSVGELRGQQPDAEGVTYHWETSRPAAMIALAAARYAVHRGAAATPAPPGAGPRPPGAAMEALPEVTCYLFPRHRERAEGIAREARAVLRYLTRRLGPFPYRRVAVAEIPRFPGGYGSTGLVMLGEEVLAAGPPDRELLAHEIAHQWWGNSVFPQGPGAAWLTEGFASYCAWSYVAEAGDQPALPRRRVSRAVSAFFAAADRQGDQPLAQMDPYLPVGAAEAALYEKGAVVLHMLRRELGDEAFFAVLRRFAAEHAHSTATVADFRRLATRVAGRDLEPFFRQWLDRPGGMALEYSFRTEAGEEGRPTLVLQVRQPPPAYQARVALTLQVGNSVERHTVQLAGERAELRIPVGGRVTSVLFDPDGDLLLRPPRWEPDGLQ